MFNSIINVFRRFATGNYSERDNQVLYDGAVIFAIGMAGGMLLFLLTY